MEKDEEKIENENEINKKDEITINNETHKTEAVDNVKKENTEANEDKEIKENKQEDIKKVDNFKVKEEVTTKSKHEKESEVSYKKILIIALSIISLLFISTIFAILNINNSNIISGVHIENVNLSGLSKEEATNKINEKANIIEDNELSYGEYSTIVKLEDIGLEISTKEAINNAISLGKTNNIVIDNYRILFANIFKTKFELDIEMN